MLKLAGAWLDMIARHESCCSEIETQLLDRSAEADKTPGVCHKSTKIEGVTQKGCGRHQSHGALAFVAWLHHRRRCQQQVICCSIWQIQITLHILEVPILQWVFLLPWQTQDHNSQPAACLLQSQCSTTDSLKSGSIVRAHTMCESTYRPVALKSSCHLMCQPLAIT